MQGAAHSNEFVRAASDLELILCNRLSQTMIELGWRIEADMSTPLKKCIGSPEQKYISDAGKKAPELGAFSSGNPS
jgi:hypothetical protein